MPSLWWHKHCKPVFWNYWGAIPKTVGPIKNNASKGEVYTIKNKGVHIPILVVGSAWSGYAFSKIYSKDPSTVEQIENLDRNDITAFNRSAIDHFSQKAKDLGDVFFYG